jgi:hypothetical protein
MNNREERAENAELRVPMVTSLFFKVIHSHCIYAKPIEVVRLD